MERSPVMSSRPGCSCAERSQATEVGHTCGRCCSAAIRRFLGGVDNQELFARVDSRVSVRGLDSDEDPFQALESWFKTEGLDPLVV